MAARKRQSTQAKAGKPPKRQRNSKTEKQKSDVQQNADQKEPGMKVEEMILDDETQLSGIRSEENLEELSLAKNDILDEATPMLVVPDEESQQTQSVQYEACFGVIEADVTVLNTPTNENGDTSTLTETIPVTIEPSKDALKIYGLENTKQIGAATMPALSDTISNHRLTLTAFVQIRPTKQIAKMDGWHLTPRGPVPTTLRVVLYGFLSEQATIGEALSRGELYLQHPFEGECDPLVPYENPHYFRRPGADMPKLENMALRTQTRMEHLTSETLGDVDKAQLLQMFESSIELDSRSKSRPSSRLKTKLKDHQLSALTLMIERECGVVDDAKFPQLWTEVVNERGQPGYRHIITGALQNAWPVLLRGGIIADEMGLGKTLSTLSLIAWHLDVLDGKDITVKVDTLTARTTLIVTPVSTIHEWKQQIQCHLGKSIRDPVIYHGADRQQLAQEMQNADIVITTYDTLRSDNATAGLLFRQLWGRVVLDEAHTIRNRSSGLFKAARAVKAQRRWCLTGTPIQNSLDDFGSLLAFIRVSPFESQESFRFWINKPGRWDDRNFVFDRLRALVKSTCIRRTKAMIGGELKLPEKVEIVQEIDLDKNDMKIYQFFKRRTSAIAQKSPTENATDSQPKSRSILPLIGTLRLICNHGEDLLSDSARKAWRERDADKIDWNMLSATSKQCETCGSLLEEGADPVCSRCRVYEEDQPAGLEVSTRQEGWGQSPIPSPSRGIFPMPRHSRSASSVTSVEEDYQPSAKVRALLKALQHNESSSMNAGSRKSVVFSYWTRMLDLIQRYFRQKGIRFQRIDGQTTLSKRMEALEEFERDPTCTVLLASIGSLREGVNLTAANSVHIMEPQWNPMVEAQAVDRIHRIGQERPVTVTRYFVKNSIESYVKAVQDDKLRLIHQSLSNTKPEPNKTDERHLKMLLETLK